MAPKDPALAERLRAAKELLRQNKDPVSAAAGRVTMARRYGDAEAERQAKRDLAELRADRLRRKLADAERELAKANEAMTS